MDLKGKKIKLHDNALRDGMHSVSHQFSLDDMVRMAVALDEAGMPLIEVTHGDGLGGSSVNYGFGKHSNREYLEAVVPKMKNAKIKESTSHHGTELEKQMKNLPKIHHSL